jgi:hypothetical protein
MKQRMVVAVAALAGACCAAMPGTASASVAGDWNLAFQSRTAGLFSSIAAISKNNSWAVGELLSGRKTVYRPLIRHFDGSGWKAITISGARFSSDWVAASSAKNVWVLGTSTSRTNPTTAYRYDGSRWHKVPIPALTDLQDPVVLGPTSVWAIGSSGTSAADVFHWNGRGWHGYNLKLLPEALSASAANNVWVAGLTFGGSGQKATAYRWNGTRWLSVAMPHPAVADNPGVTASSPSNVWIGWATASATSAMHWDGHHWHGMTAPGSVPANSFNIVPDGHGGDWFGPFARWTGHSWIGPVNVSPENSGGGFGPVVWIPGASSYWLAAGVTNTGSSTEEPTIYRYDLP